jgi:hypothetical protein
MQRVHADHSHQCRWRLRTFGLILVGLLATAAQGQELALQLNQEILTDGETLSLTATANPQGSLVDVYIALITPSAELFFLAPNGGLTTTPQTLTPEGLAEAVSTEIFRRTLTGDEPSGPYTWLGVLTAHGTLEFVSGIAQAPFLVID